MKLFTNKFIICLAFFVSSLFSVNNIFAQFPSWGTVGTGTNGVVNSVIDYNGNLIAAGFFTTPGRNIARYNGIRWDTLSTGIDDTVFALAIYNNKLIAVGAFDTAGGVACSKIAQWDGTAWSPMGTGANNTIFTVDTVGSSLFIGGRFTMAGGVNCSRLAKWQDTSWSALGLGVNGNVYAFEHMGSGLIIGGAFVMAGADTVNRIVRYDLDSGTYTPLGNGIDSNNVFALSEFQGVLYAGGDFITIDGDTVNRLAIWNDTVWTPIGTGVNGSAVRTLDAFGAGLLCIGGSFTSINGTNGNNIIACGGPSSFAPFGGGLSGSVTNPRVNKVIGWRGVTVAGGFFSNTNVARWALLPLAPELILPPEAESGVSFTPLFTWNQGQWMYSFNIQVARDANFLNLTIADSNLLVPQFQVPDSTPLLNLVTYFWRVRASNGAGNGPYSLIRFFITGIVGEINNNEIPASFNLYQNYPNPFNPVTKIKFDLPHVNGDANLKLSIYNVNGQRVAELLNTAYTAGKWELNFDASNLASGIYFYVISASHFTETRKMILLK